MIEEHWRCDICGWEGRGDEGFGTHMCNPRIGMNMTSGGSPWSGDISWNCPHGIDTRRERCLLCNPVYDWPESPWKVPLDSYWSGHCGKCGAPFTRDYGGYPQPICVCWNLPDTKTTDGV